MVKCVTIFRPVHFLKKARIGNKTQHFHNLFCKKHQKWQQNTTFLAGKYLYMRNPIPSLAEKYLGKAVKFAVLTVLKPAGNVGFISLRLFKLTSARQSGMFRSKNRFLRRL